MPNWSILPPEEPITKRDTPKAKEADEDWDRFSEEERVTSNLGLRSIAPVYRAFIGLIAFIPRVWRGPIVALVFGILGFLAAQVTPQLVDWIKSK